VEMEWSCREKRPSGLITPGTMLNICIIHPPIRKASELINGNCRVSVELLDVVEKQIHGVAVIKIV
jgi:hypothetical protein